MSFLPLFFSSILFFLSHPNFLFPSGLGFLIFFTYIPVFYQSENWSLKKGFVSGLLWSIAAYSLFGYWLFKYEDFLFFVTVIWFSIFYGFCFFSLAALNKIDFSRIKNKNYGILLKYLLKALIFAVFEALKASGDFGFSYGNAVYALWKIPCAVKLSSLFGAFGVEVLLLIFSSLAAAFLNNKLSHEKKKIILLSLIIYSAVFFSSGSIILAANSRSSKISKSIKIALVQNNSDPRNNDIDYNISDIYSLMQLTEKTLEKSPEIEMIVWPETAVVPSILKNYSEIPEQNNKRSKAIRDLMIFFDRYKGKIFVTGNGNNNFNSALVFKGGENCNPPSPLIYNKVHLVPLSEYLPSYFGFLKPLLEKMNVDLWNKGKEIKIFEENTAKGSIKFSTPICFEDTFSYIPKAMKKKGSELFVTLTNDAWSHSIPAQNQHLSMAVFRSAENNIPSVRSTVSGTTCLIDRNGRIVKELKPFIKDAIVVDVEL